MCRLCGSRYRSTAICCVNYTLPEVKTLRLWDSEQDFRCILHSTRALLRGSRGGGIHMHRVFIAVLLLAATCTGQEFRATLSGRVTDAQNSVVPGVRISVVQIGTEAKFETVSDHNGLYSVPFLPPAT